jgi:hypothetical protein
VIRHESGNASSNLFLFPSALIACFLCIATSIQAKPCYEAAGQAQLSWPLKYDSGKSSDFNWFYTLDRNDANYKARKEQDKAPLQMDYLLKLFTNFDMGADSNNLEVVLTNYENTMPGSPSRTRFIYTVYWGDCGNPLWRKSWYLNAFDYCTIDYTTGLNNLHYSLGKPSVTLSSY